MTPTRKQAKLVWKQTCKAYGTKVFYPWKLTSRIMSLLRMSPLSAMKKELISMGVESVDEFLKSRWITIVFRNKKYISCPELIGGKGTDPVRQITTCAHEHQHVEQFGGGTTQKWNYCNYFLQKGARALLEAEADAAGADARLAMQKKPYKAESLFDNDWRDVYCLKKIHSVKAAALYNNLMQKHARGAWATKAGAHVAIIARMMSK